MSIAQGKCGVFFAKNRIFLRRLRNKHYLCGKIVSRTKAVSKYEIPYLTACIQAFGRRFAMTRQEAFRYLHKYKGLVFLIEFYDVEHLQSMNDTINDLLIICQRNGGSLA